MFVCNLKSPRYEDFFSINVTKIKAGHFLGQGKGGVYSRKSVKMTTKFILGSLLKVGFPTFFCYD